MERVWLNCAHQGPLPLVAVKAAQEAIRWKQAPYELTSDRFVEVRERLRHVLARLIHASADDIILGNSASYGLHLLANGLTLRAGDEVLVMANDFPSNLLPWLRRQSEGIVVTRIRPRDAVVEAADVEAHVTSRTRVLCLTWVQSFSGWSIDVDAIGELCRQRHIVFVLNASQAIGARPLDVQTTPVDAVVSVGFKWLCGPYGTGFCWMRPEVRDQMVPQKAYWLSVLTANDLAAPLDIVFQPGSDVRRFDIFGTANFFNFMPWTASVEYLLDCGIDRVAEYDGRLVRIFLEGLNREHYHVQSPESGPRQSTLIVVSHRDALRNSSLFKALEVARVHVAMRAGGLRVSPHLYNQPHEVVAALDVLNRNAEP